MAFVISATLMPKRPRRAIGHAGILPVMRSLQGGHGAQINPRHFLAILPITENAINRRNTFLYFVDHGNRTHTETILDTHGNFSAPLVINADHCRISRILFGKHSRLDRRVIFHGAVTIQMIRRQIDQNPHIRFQTGHQVNLKRRKLENIDAVLHRRPHEECRCANISAHVHITAGDLERYARSRPWWWTCHWFP